MKTKEQAKAHLIESLPNVESRYKEGIGQADWQTKAASDNAEKNFADSMSKVIASKKRQTKIKAMSNADWQAAAATKGGAVIQQRMRDSVEKQSANWGGIYDRVAADVQRLVPRTTDFRTNVQNRVLGTVEAWKKHSGKL